MVRACVSSVVFIVLTLIATLLAVPSRLFDPSGDGVLWLARWWARGVLATAGVRLEVRARGRLDPARPYVFMANHLSFMDVWPILVSIPVSLRFIAKKQIAAIPLFGWAMHAGRFIFIDRQNSESARRSIAEAARRIRAGQSVVLFPEGTRSRDGRLGPFKKGGFHLAVDSGADIVPLAIRGTRELMPRGTLLIRAGAVSLDIDEPIPTAGLSPEGVDALLERVRGRIAEMLSQAEPS